MKSVKAQAGFGANKKAVISLGKKNGNYLKSINEELKLFDRVDVLDHPRFIMQYRRKSLSKYINEYLRILSLTD